ncbi:MULTISPECIES: coenzyme F420-0:L-glutamate ligase [Streptomyces]|uniref:coenzyme F420-0:L-glutamate ligase n=1 Tax=Streptomyces TaxID=1883 RepID=UPI00345C4B58
MNITSAYQAFALEPFPEIKEGASITQAITDTIQRQDQALQSGDIVVVASKPISIAEGCYVSLDTITPTQEALKLSARTGKPAEIVQLILNESTSHFLATDRGPIIAQHRLGYQLTSAGVDRAEPGGAWLLPADPDASARRLRDELAAATGTRVAVVIADSDGRADRRGATVIAIGAAGIAPLRVSEAPGGKRQEETLVDMITAAAGIIMGQRGRGAPVVILRGITFDAEDEGVAAMLHHRP